MFQLLLKKTFQIYTHTFMLKIPYFFIEERMQIYTRMFPKTNNAKLSMSRNRFTRETENRGNQLSLAFRRLQSLFHNVRVLEL